MTYNREDFLALERQYRNEEGDHHGIVILHPRRFAQGSPTVGALITSLEGVLTAEAPYPAFVHWLR